MLSSQYSHRLRVLIAGLVIAIAIPLHSTVVAANSLFARSLTHSSTIQTLFEQHDRQWLQAQALDPADAKLLAESLKVPAETLVESYRLTKKVFDFLPLAEHGVILQTPGGAIGPSNVKEARAELAKMISVYETAIRQRGYQTISGQYHAEATPACTKIHSAWAYDVSQSKAWDDLAVSQENFTTQFVHQIKRENATSTIQLPGTIVESAVSFEDPLNSDFVFIGEITRGTIKIRPDVEAVLAAWPPQELGFTAPSREDLSNCLITLTANKNPN